jgi:hypothetical protein
MPCSAGFKPFQRLTRELQMSRKLAGLSIVAAAIFWTAVEARSQEGFSNTFSYSQTLEASQLTGPTLPEISSLPLVGPVLPSSDAVVDTLGGTMCLHGSYRGFDLSGSLGCISKTGCGKLTLNETSDSFSGCVVLTGSASNNYTGTTYILNGGVLQSNVGTATIAGDRGVTLAGSNTYGGGFSSGGSILSVNHGVLQLDNNLFSTFSYPDFAGPQDITNGTLVGPVQNTTTTELSGGLVEVGSGTLTLTGSTVSTGVLTLSGGNTLSGGTLQINSNPEQFLNVTGCGTLSLTSGKMTLGTGSIRVGSLAPVIVVGSSDPASATVVTVTGPSSLTTSSLNVGNASESVGAATPEPGVLLLLLSAGLAGLLGIQWHRSK